MQKFICLFPALVFAALLAMVNNGCSAKDKKAYYLERADRYFAAGQYDEAEIEYMNVLRNDRENFQAISRLADIYFEEGRLKKAAPFIFKGYELATNDLNLNLKLGVIYLASGKLKEARAEANFVLDRNPQDERAPFLLVESALTAKDAEETRARLQLLSQKSDSAALQAAMANMAIRARDFKAAEISLKRAQALNPKSSAVWSALGALYLVQTNLTQAESAFKSAADFAPARSQEKLLYAEFKIQNGDVAAGRQLLAEMVKKTPDYIPALIKLAKIDANEAKYDDCAALLNKALAREPDNFDALLLSGQLQLAQGKTAEATAGFERMVKDYPQAPRAHYQLAVAYLSANEAEPAVKSLSRAVALDADFTEAILLLAELQIRMANADPAIAALKPLIQQHPEIMPAQLLLAGAYRVKNQFNEALGIYRRLAAANPANFQIPLLIGETFLQQKNPVEARKAFTKSLELLPDNFTAVQQLVILDLAEKQYAVALQRVQPLLEKTPKLAAPVLLKAQIFLAQGDTKQAEAALLKVVELQPDVETAYLLLARLYVDSKQNQKALVELKLAAEKNPTDTAPLLITGMIHSEERDYKAARDAYEKALVISPKFSLALNNLAYLYSEQLDDLGRAYELSQKARSLLPGDPATADTLGWILYKRGQYSSALSLLQESAGKLPDEPEVQFHLGKTYYMLSEAGQATVAFQRALQSSRDFQGKDECKQCLAVLAVDVKTAGADARASLEKRVAGQPGDFIALLRLATIYQREGNSDKAVAAYESVLKADASNLMALINLAQLYAANPKTTQRAFELAKAAYKLAPDNVEVAKIYGRLAFETGDYKLSLNFLQEIARNEPGNMQVLFDFARAAYAMGRVPDAQAAMRTVLQNGGAFSGANEAKRFLNLTALADNPAQALAAADQVAGILKSEPGYVPALMILAGLAEQKNDVSSAQQAYGKVLSQYPDFAPAQKRLAMLIAENTGSIPQAYDLATKARTAYPTDPEVAQALGIILYQQGDYARAEKMLKESVAKLNSDPKAFYYLGMAQYRLKKPIECKAAFQRALSLNPSVKFAEEIKRVLAELK